MWVSPLTHGLEFEVQVRDRFWGTKLSSPPLHNLLHNLLTLTKPGKGGALNLSGPAGATASLFVMAFRVICNPALGETKFADLYQVAPHQFLDNIHNANVAQVCFTVLFYPTGTTAVTPSECVIWHNGTKDASWEALDLALDDTSKARELFPDRC